MASWRAEPFAYASIILDCQPAAVAERRPAERTISTIRPTSTRAPRRIQSHSRSVPVPPFAAGEPAAVGVGVGVVVVVTVGPAVVTVGPAAVLVMVPGVVELRLGEILAIALLTELVHPAAIHPAARIATERKKILISRRMAILPRSIRNRR
jgi:hypothetical protein